MTAIVKAAQRIRRKNSILEAGTLADVVIRVLSFYDVTEMLFGGRVWDKPKNNYTLFLKRSCQLPASLPSFKPSAVRKMLPVFTLILWMIHPACNTIETRCFHWRRDSSDRAIFNVPHILLEIFAEKLYTPLVTALHRHAVVENFDYQVIRSSFSKQCLRSWKFIREGITVGATPLACLRVRDGNITLAQSSVHRRICLLTNVKKYSFYHSPPQSAMNFLEKSKETM